ncbi:MAG: hypothetical protein P8O07_11185 [Crocinitomicaceae bacterium]|nr:hypothetical protein [Crocinitomicaceae bacterium]
MANVPVVQKEDDIKGMIAAALALMITLFLLFFIKYHEPDPPKVTIPIPITMSEEGIDEFEIFNAGGGAPSSTTVTEAVTQPAAQEQATQEESVVSVPSGNQGATNNSSSETSQQASPFSGTGTGGSGTDGSGGGFGSDNGPGSGTGVPGTGSAGERIRKNNLKSNPKTPNTALCQIALKLIIDANGNVVSVLEIRENTTTTNQVLIDEVKSLVKKEVKYDARLGAPNATVFYTVTVQPG